MDFRVIAALFFASGTLLQAVGLRVAAFNIGAHFTTSSGGIYYPDYGLGAPGTPDFDTVRDILARISADVVSLEEIHNVDISAGHVNTLASTLGYGYVFVAPATNTFDTSLRVAIFSRYPFLSQALVASPAGAKEMTRLIPVVKIDVPGTTRDPVLAGAHLKSGSDASDLFQRTVELRRLTNLLTANGLTAADNFLVMGDFNLSSNPRTFTGQPASGLPSTYSLGADIAFPISYYTDPTLYFNNPAVTRILPRQLDGSAVTFPSSGSTIDIFLASGIIGARPRRTEIYNSALDTSNTSGLQKYGAPLATATSATASDHFAIFGDFELDPALPYEVVASGQTIAEKFHGFPGTYDPYPWTTTVGSWQGVDNGASTVPGFRAYGPTTEPSLGFLPGATGGTATADFVNHATAPLTAIHFAYTAEQWRAANGGSADQLSAELIVDGVARPLPALTFQAATNLPNGPVAGGTSTARSMLVSDLSVAPGAPFHLRFTFTPGPGGGLPPAEVFINEFHYDNAGTDSGEFVEIVAGPGFTGALTTVSLLLYNGADGGTYGSAHALSTFTAGAVTSSGHRVFSKAIPGIQNGDPDGFALVVNGIVTQFISYGGSFTATNGAASGLVSTDIGVKQTAEVVGQASLGLTGTGGSPASFTWTKFFGLPYTAGQPNQDQTFTAAPQPQGIAIDNLAVTAFTGADSDGDGMSDIAEYLFGSDPWDAASRYTVTLTQTAADKQTLSFHRIAGSSYVLESSTDLTRWDTWKSYPAGIDSDTNVGLTISPGTPARFYRVRAMQP